MTYSAAFLDRDGTILHDPGYPSDPEAVELLPGAAEAIARLNAAGVPVLVVTNQSGIGRGLLGVEEFLAVQRAAERKLRAASARVDGVYYCPHDPEREPCACRKPGLGLYRRAADERGIRLPDALFIGDRVRDVLPALELGGAGWLLRGGGETPPPGIGLAEDLRDAVERALARVGRGDRSGGRERAGGSG